MYVIPANFGNDSVALIQWAAEQSLTDVAVVYVETGWAAPEWPARVEQCEAWVSGLGFKWVVLRPQADFVRLMQTRGSFPSRKFQWCAGFLKGLPLLAWLDQVECDPDLEATILLAHRRAAAVSLNQLPEHIEDSPHYGERAVWHPLFKHDDADILALVERSGSPILAHRSLECDPCVNSDQTDLCRMSTETLHKAAALETEMAAQLLDPALYHGTADLVAARERTDCTAVSAGGNIFSMGCGSPFGCGL